MSSLKQEAVNKVNLSKAEVRYQPEYICPWVTVVVFPDGYEFALSYRNSAEVARLVRDQWNNREGGVG